MLVESNFMRLNAQQWTTSETMRSAAARVVLCLALLFQLGAPLACRTPVVGDETSVALAALSQATGHTIVLCQHGEDGAPGHTHHPGHGCCDCGLCHNLADPSSPPNGVALVVPTAIAGAHGFSRAPPVLARAPSVAATSPRGPPVPV